MINKNDRTQKFIELTFNKLNNLNYDSKTFEGNFTCENTIDCLTSIKYSTSLSDIVQIE